MRKRILIPCATLCALFCAALSIGAQETSSVIWAFNFDGGLQRWQGIGSTVKVSRTQEPENVKNGEGALQLEYQIAQGEKAVAIVLLADKSFATLQTVQFWAKADYDTTLNIVLSEAKGGRFEALCFVPAKKWQKIVFTPKDFMLATDPNAPQDANGKLDLDKLETLAIADYRQFALSAGDPESAKLFAAPAGAHKLCLDDISLLSEPTPDTTLKSGTDTLMEDFTRPQLGWVHIGAGTLAIAEGKPLVGKSLKIDYKQEPNGFFAASRNLATKPFPKTAQIGMKVASLKPCRLLIQVEEAMGGKYQLIINVPAGESVQDIVRSFKEFTPAPDSKDPDKTLSPEKIHRLVLMDLTGIFDKANTTNTLWVNNIRAVTK